MKLPSQLKSKINKPNWTSLAGICLLSLFTVNAVHADTWDQARRMHDRLAGIPPTPEVLCAMQAHVAGADYQAAAMVVMASAADGTSWLNDPNNCNGGSAIDNSASKKAFYSTSLKNFVTPWTNEEQTVYAPLNDFTATVIGIIRDNEDFRDVLTGNYIYKGTDTYSNTNNTAYEDLEMNNADLSDNSVLMQASQASVGIPGDPEDRGGVTTTRAAGMAFFKDGTNRAMFRYTLLNFLCTDLEQIKDTTRVPDRVRQDVSRSPGGDSSIFLNACVGCHSGMDPLAGAYAYYDWDNDNEQLSYSQTIVHNLDADPPIKHKYLINASNFPTGYVTTDNSWKNYWRAGPNSALGWANNTDGSVTSGSGINTMHAELANTDVFAQCQVEKVYEHVCLQSPIDDHQANIVTITNSFKGDHNLKNVFASTAALCRGD